MVLQTWRGMLVKKMFMYSTMSSQQKGPKGWRTGARRAAALGGLGALYLGAGLAYNVMPRQSLAPASMPPAAQWYGGLGHFVNVPPANRLAKMQAALKQRSSRPQKRLLDKAVAGQVKNPFFRASDDSHGLQPGAHIVTYVQSANPFYWPVNPGSIRWSQIKNTQMSAVSRMRQMSAASRIGNAKNAWNLSRSLMHHGVYIGNGVVLDYPDGLRTIEDFVAGMKAYIVPHATHSRPDIIVKRAMEASVASLVTGKNKSYGMMYHNCEHFANFIVTGKATSLQVAQVLVPMVIIGGFAVVEILKAEVRAAKQSIAEIRRLVHIVRIGVDATRRAITSPKVSSRWEQLKNAFWYA